MKLIYVGDPMCSWCYGFGKELSAFTERYPELPLEILVGGVRAGATDILDDSGKQFRLAHWERVQETSGLPFNREAFLARENFVYDTEPVCRAVVTARRLAPQADLLAVFRALQHAFYKPGSDPTSSHGLVRKPGSDPTSSHGLVRAKPRRRIGLLPGALLRDVTRPNIAQPTVKV